MLWPFGSNSAPKNGLFEYELFVTPILEPCCIQEQAWSSHEEDLEKPWCTHGAVMEMFSSSPGEFPRDPPVSSRSWSRRESALRSRAVVELSWHSGAAAGDLYYACVADSFSQTLLETDLTWAVSLVYKNMSVWTGNESKKVPCNVRHYSLLGRHAWALKHCNKSPD